LSSTAAKLREKARAAGCHPSSAEANSFYAALVLREVSKVKAVVEDLGKRLKSVTLPQHEIEVHEFPTFSSVRALVEVSTDEIKRMVI